MTEPTRFDVLRQIPYFAGLPAGELRDLAGRLSEQRYRSGQVIFREGERCEALYLVLSGRVRTVKTSPEGREQTLHVFGPGRSFADIAAFDEGLHPGTAIAMKPTTVALIRKADLTNLILTHPQIALAVIRLFASRLRAFTQIVEDLSLRNVATRVASLLVALAHGEWSLVEEPASQTLRFTQEELAAMTGSVREVVQRALKTLEQTGAIEMSRGSVRIVDPPLLERWLRSQRTMEAESARPAKRRASGKRR
jgi:CRP/FNR family transcriptional regulator